MNTESPLVDRVRDVTDARPAKRGARVGERTIEVRFAGGATAHLDRANPRDRVWAEVLQSLRASRKPVYVEIDPASGRIATLLLPREFAVAAIRETENGDRVIDLEISQARHYLRRGLPGFDRMLAILETARREHKRVLVTESLDSSALIDVRLVSTGNTAKKR